MKIAVATHLGRVNGGLEAYLCSLVPALAAAGHEVALWYDADGSGSRRPIDAPAGAPRWDAGKLGRTHAVEALRAWAPDLIFSHGLAEPDTERALLAVAPGVLFAHAYYGTCISGSKSRLSPTRAPCDRPLGWPCLVHYLPRRCGGLDPIRMIKLYDLAARQRDLLDEYRFVVVASPHMRTEYLRNGVPAARLHVVDLMMPDEVPAVEVGLPVLAQDPEYRRANEATPLSGEWRLLCIGRLTELKGVGLLIDSLRTVRKSYGGRITLTVVGDGAELNRLQRRAQELTGTGENISVHFTGWLDHAAQVDHLLAAHLLVLPSVWPEPFGLVGPEAGRFGVPAAAFDVGGIPAWLHDGENGHLAPGRRPTATGLAGAIVRCLEDPAHHTRLSAGAIRVAQRFTLERHMAQVLPILERAAAARSMVASP